MERASQAKIYTKVLEVIRLLRESRKRIVFAESCTGGAVAANFTVVPGVSEVFCGSMVVYRNDSKTQWLGLDPVMLADPEIGSVSPQTSQLLAQQVLAHTPEADFALAVTGHFGPDAPAHLNRRIFVALVRRGDFQVWTKNALLPDLASQASVNGPAGAFKKDSMCEIHPHIRSEFQAMAVEWTLDLVLEALS
ncbi:MAG: CinA family protein [Pirellula sp.]|nr:CinA family protein [Pirellula sp.]